MEHIAGAPIGPESYVYFSCRCPDCTERYMALGKTARERRINAPKPVHVHGTWNGYNNWGCRCDKCLEACRSTYDYAAAWRRVNRAELNDKQRERRQKKRLDN